MSRLGLPRASQSRTSASRAVICSWRCSVSMSSAMPSRVIRSRNSFEPSRPTTVRERSFDKGSVAPMRRRPAGIASAASRAPASSASSWRAWRVAQRSSPAPSVAKR